MSEEKLITDPERQEKVYRDACGLLDRSHISYVLNEK